MDSDLEHEFSPNSPPRGHYSDLGSKGVQKGSKSAKRLAKHVKTAQNGAQRVPKSYENPLKTGNDNATIYKSSPLFVCSLLLAGCQMLAIRPPFGP